MQKRTLGEKIVALRKEYGKSQEELAQAVCVTRQTVSKWESDLSVPSLENVQTMGNWFGVNTDYFFCDDDITAQKTTAVVVDSAKTMRRKFPVKLTVAVAFLGALLILLITCTAILGAMYSTVNTGDIVVVNFTPEAVWIVLFALATVFCLSGEILLIISLCRQIRNK